MKKSARFQKLLHEQCVTYGNCGSGDIHVTDLLPKTGSISAREFAELMLRAEKMTAFRYGKQYWDSMLLIEQKFKQHMGADLVEIKDIWSN